MFHRNQIIRTDVDLQNCIYLQIPVDVWVGEHKDECNVFIVDFTDETVKIGSDYYIRGNCIIRVSQ